MKVELDLSTEQLQKLDEGLVNLLETLSDEQKTELIKGYLKEKMDDNFYTKNSGYYSSSTELSSFGRKVIDGLQDKIAQNVTDSLFADEEIVKRIDDTAKTVTNSLDKIISESIVTYVINNLFRNSDNLQSMICMTVNNMLRNSR